MLDGILLGLLLSVMTGPIFFALIETSIQRGFWAGFTLSTGVWLSDIIYISLVFKGLGFISDNPDFRFYMGLLGGIVLIAFGLGAMLAKIKMEQAPVKGRSYIDFFLKGVAVNIFNPFVFAFWVGIISSFSERAFTQNESIAYLASILITVGVTDIIKVWLADRIKQKLKPGFIQGLKFVAGVGLIVFGIVMIWRVV